MYLVSSSSHNPEAVFDQWAAAERYLCEKASVSTKFSCVKDMPGKPTMHKLYVEAYGPYPEFTLGYITEGIQINPRE